MKNGLFFSLSLIWYIMLLFTITNFLLSSPRAYERILRNFREYSVMFFPFWFIVNTLIHFELCHLVSNDVDDDYCWYAVAISKGRMNIRVNVELKRTEWFLFIMDEDDVMKRTLFQHAQMFLRYMTRQYSTAHSRFFFQYYCRRLSFASIMEKHNILFLFLCVFLPLHLRNSSPTQSLLLSSSPCVCVSSFFLLLFIIEISLFLSLSLFRF